MRKKMRKILPTKENMPKMWRIKKEKKKIKRKKNSRKSEKEYFQIMRVSKIKYIPSSTRFLSLSHVFLTFTYDRWFTLNFEFQNNNSKQSINFRCEKKIDVENFLGFRMFTKKWKQL